MPTVEGNIFEVRIWKSLGAANGKQYSNTYHITNDASDIKDPSFVPLVMSLVLFEQTITTGDTFFHRATVSTVQADSDGLEDTDRTIPLGFGGSQNPSTGVGRDGIELERTFEIAFAPMSGRAGVKEYRGVLDEGRIDIVDGDPLYDTANMANYLATAIQTLKASNTFGHLVVASKRGNTWVGRPVFDIVAKGVAWRKTTARRRPKLNRKTNAMINRAGDLVKELQLLKASTIVTLAEGGEVDLVAINAALALGGIEPIVAGG